MATSPAYTMDHTSNPLDPDVLALQVDAAERLAEEIIGLTLSRPDGGPLPAWDPGAHVDLLLANGMERQYSPCGDPREVARWRLAIRREQDGRGGSRLIHDELRAGDMVRVRGPRNHFALVPAPRYQFIAGGIGITPILPMIRAVAATGVPWELLYGGRSRPSMAFLDELGALDGRGGVVHIRPEDRHGILDLPGTLAGLPGGTAVFCCGPEPLMAAAELVCAPLDGIDLHLERFAPKERVDHERDATTFEVVCAQSGVTLTVEPGDSILDAARRAGIGVASSCAEGTCGTCETTIVEGIPEHRDSFLSEAERDDNETILICVSRCRGERLVLDL
ncbi:MAG: pobB [Solirubrobacterales bacterium]|nr:pobB [Solirubrobacterales bacterium]